MPVRFFLKGPRPLRWCRHSLSQGVRRVKGGGVLWKSGSFEPGYCFDAVILDDSRLCDGVQRTPYERMERLITRSDDRDICAKYIDGVCVYKKGE